MKIPVIVLGAALVLAGCSSADSSDKGGTAPVTQPGGSAITASAGVSPNPDVVGPLTDPASSPILREAESLFSSMKSTEYTHTYTEDPGTGTYDFDCVGFTDYVLHQANPSAWNALHDQLHIERGYVPNPNQWYGFFTGSSGKLPSSWQQITSIADVQPGDFFAFTSNNGSANFETSSGATDANGSFVGHAAIAAGPPVAMSDGSYALRVFDSTGSAHGPFDTRLTDPRAVDHSGLGNGTMRFFVTNGAITSAAWSVDAGGPGMNGVQVAVARAV